MQQLFNHLKIKLYWINTYTYYLIKTISNLCFVKGLQCCRMCNTTNPSNLYGMKIIIGEILIGRQYKIMHCSYFTSTSKQPGF